MHFYYVVGLERLLGDSSPALNSGRIKPEMIPKWNNAGHLIKTMNVNPRAYVEWLFNRSLPQYPYPNMVLSENSIRLFASRPKDFEAEMVRFSWSSMEVRLRAALARGQDMFKALMDPMMEFNPLFVVFMMSHSGRFAELSLDTVNAARQHLRVNPVYAELYPDLIPKELSSAAK